MLSYILSNVVKVQIMFAEESYVLFMAILSSSKNAYFTRAAFSQELYKTGKWNGKVCSLSTLPNVACFTLTRPLEPVPKYWLIKQIPLLIHRFT